MPIVLEEGQRFPGTGPLPALCPFMVSLRTAMAPAGVSFSHRATLNTYEAHGPWEATVLHWTRMRLTARGKPPCYTEHIWGSWSMGSHRATLNTYEAHGSWEATSSAILDLVGSQRVLLFLLTQMSFFSRLCPALFSLVSIRLWAAGVSGWAISHPCLELLQFCFQTKCGYAHLSRKANLLTLGRSEGKCNAHCGAPDKESGWLRLKTPKFPSGFLEQFLKENVRGGLQGLWSPVPLIGWWGGNRVTFWESQSSAFWFQASGVTCLCSAWSHPPPPGRGPSLQQKDSEICVRLCVCPWRRS